MAATQEALDLRDKVLKVMKDSGEFDDHGLGPVDGEAVVGVDTPDGVTFFLEVQPA